MATTVYVGSSLRGMPMGYDNDYYRSSWYPGSSGKQLDSWKPKGPNPYNTKLAPTHPDYELWVPKKKQYKSLQYNYPIHQPIEIVTPRPLSGRSYRYDVAGKRDNAIYVSQSRAPVRDDLFKLVRITRRNSYGDDSPNWPVIVAFILFFMLVVIVGVVTVLYLTDEID